MTSVLHITNRAPAGKPVAGLAAGSHFDPGQSSKHLGPRGMEHLRDPPVHYFDEKGRAGRVSITARLETKDLAGRSIMIHAGGDNPADRPA